MSREQSLLLAQQKDDIAMMMPIISVGLWIEKFHVKKSDISSHPPLRTPLELEHCADVGIDLMRQRTESEAFIIEARNDRAEQSHCVAVDVRPKPILNVLPRVA